jgi:hypothetical protein
MKVNRTSTVSVLGLALLACALPVLAEETVDLPAQEGRMWAPAGDVIGQDNHYSGTAQAKDSQGNEAKGAEDWQLVQKNSWAGLIGLFHTKDNGKRYWFRASGDNGGTGGPVGKYDLGGKDPGKYNWFVDYRDFDYFYDRSSEMRSPDFSAPPPPPELGVLPSLNWKRAKLGLNVRLSDQFNLAGGYNLKRRRGCKGSLLRGLGNSGPSAPGHKLFATTTNEFWGGIGFATGGFGSNLNLSYNATEGTRNHMGQHTYTDDQTTFRAKLGLAYAVSDNVKLTGHGSTSKLENTGSEGAGSSNYDVNGETTTNAGRLGLLAGLGKSMNLVASADFRNLDTDAQTNLAADVQQATDRKRDSQDYRIGLSYHGLAKTHLRLGYRYGKSNLEETMALDDVPGSSQVSNYQINDQKKTRQDLGFHGRYRFGRTANLKAVVAWQSLDVDQKDPVLSDPGDPLHYWMGDRQRDRLRWELALRTRPWRTVRFDIGHQAIDQTYERKDSAQSETTWKTSRGFANVNWMPLDILTVYGMFSYGVDKYGLTGDPVPTAEMNAIAYDGATMRFTPGATVVLAENLHVEGYYEGVRFEDKGNDEVIQVLQADHDRLLLRAGYEFKPELRLSASYTRNDFEENRWDDYIHHLYALSLSGTF